MIIQKGREGGKRRKKQRHEENIEKEKIKKENIKRNENEMKIKMKQNIYKYME